MARKLPHLVLFNPDMWRGDVMGHMGHPAAVTPHFDAFARDEAVSFRQAHCQNPVCTPSRCSFFTGHYPHTAGHRTMRNLLHPHEPHLLKVLKEQGYHIWWGGKNDFLAGQLDWSEVIDEVFHPTEADFERWGLQPEREEQHHDHDWRGPEDGDHFYSFHYGKLKGSGQRMHFDHDWQCIYGAMDKLRTYDGEAPLCILLTLHFPHCPYAVEDPYFSAIDRDKVPAPIPIPAADSGKATTLLEYPKVERTTGWTVERWRELQATYYGMVARVDAQFGELRAALRESGKDEDTAILAWSDHGDYVGDYGCVEKLQNSFEDALTRVPFLLRPQKGVGVQPRISEALVELVDIPATVYDLCGIEDPGYTHFGESLLPVVAGETDEHRAVLFCEGGRNPGELHCTEDPDPSNMNRRNNYFPKKWLQVQEEPLHHGKAIMARTHAHKYVRRLYQPDEFYDLEADPQELSNVIDDPQYHPIVAELREAMFDWLHRTADIVPREWDERSFPRPRH